MFVFLMVCIFTFVRLGAAIVAYDTAIEAIFLYSVDCIWKDKEFNSQLEYNKMMPVVLFMGQFWNWDMWSVIDIENRDKIRINYLKHQNLK